MVGVRILNLNKYVVHIFKDCDMKTNIEEAKRWLESYMKFQDMGQVGTFCLRNTSYLKNDILKNK